MSLFSSPVLTPLLRNLLLTIISFWKSAAAYSTRVWQINTFHQLRNHNLLPRCCPFVGVFSVEKEAFSVGYLAFLVAFAALGACSFCAFHTPGFYFLLAIPSAQDDLLGLHSRAYALLSIPLDSPSLSQTDYEAGWTFGLTLYCHRS